MHVLTCCILPALKTRSNQSIIPAKKSPPKTSKKESKKQRRRKGSVRGRKREGENIWRIEIGEWPLANTLDTLSSFL
jgi:hypothetical protein